MGLGVGQTPVVATVYLAAIAPASIRGFCNCLFAGLLYFGLVLAYFANYAFGIVERFASLTCALFLVDIIGRKRTLFIGIACQAMSLIYMPHS
ncbi:hypothetical protein VTJ04DRAFT_6961 [Mycothermus thermophilus]|uniref:uncharacterized protein n=1 Tax=Humicola insolens TaxID=85995 RepID=UPI003743CE33